MQFTAVLSWDVIVFNFDGHTPIPLSAFRCGQGPRTMGPREAVRRDIDAALADIDWSDPARGLLDAGDPVLEFDLGQAPVLDGFVIHVRRAEGAAELIAHLCLVNGWAALDGARGVYLDLQEPERWGPPHRAGSVA